MAHPSSDKAQPCVQSAEQKSSESTECDSSENHSSPDSFLSSKCTQTAPTDDTEENPFEDINLNEEIDLKEIIGPNEDISLSGSTDEAEEFELVTKADAPYSSHNEQPDHKWKYPHEWTEEYKKAAKEAEAANDEEFENITNDDEALSAWNGRAERAGKRD